jgi:hypothetical protein
VAEERIAKAMEKGEFDDLPGKGKPLELEDDSRVPEDLRLAYKVLKNAGMSPPEVEGRKEIMRMEDLLANAPDEKTRYQAIRRINYLALKIGEVRPHSAMLDEHEYSTRVLDRLTRKAGEKPPGEK